MNPVKFDHLPEGSEVRGILYDDPGMRYGSGDVLEVELPTGFTIDVGWDEETPDSPFRIVVYREYFGDRLADFNLRDVSDVAMQVQGLAYRYTTAIPVQSSCADTTVIARYQDSSQPATHLKMVACAASLFVGIIPGMTC
jgi:hypothetical protein